MYFVKTLFSLIPFLFLSCASLMQKDAKTEFALEAPNIRVEKFPVTFNLKGKGPVKTDCPANSCSPEQISKLDAGAIKSFTKDGLWEEYNELTDQDDPKKKYSVLWMKGNYKDGKKDGMWEEYEEKYDPSTKIKKLVKKQIGAFKDNKKDGIWTLLYETGEKLKETPFVDGKKHGTEKKYNQKGAQIEETNYIEGEKDGAYWKKNASELAECEGSYNKELKTGKWTEYNTDDKKPNKLKAVNLFVKDKKDGQSTSYQPDGITKLAEGLYKEDFKTGPWKQYYDNGKVESEGAKKPMPSDDKELKDQDSSCPAPNKSGRSINIGEWKKYYKSGDLFSNGSYDEQGLPTKEWKFYYKGNKIRCKGVMANALMMQSGELYDKAGKLEGKGNMMLSMFNINDKTDEMEDKMIPALPFTFYKDGKKYIELLPATSKEASDDSKSTVEVRKQTTAIEYDPSGKKIGEGPYMFIPTQPYGGKKNGCWTEGDKKVPYLMGKVQTGRLAEMSDCK